MSYKCSKCVSTFREKKNLNQHLRKYHGLKIYKCDHCDFRANDQSNIRKHEKAKHADFVFKCKLCEYNTQDRSHLNRHFRSKHQEKNIKCNQCDFLTDRDDNLKRHVIAMHTVKTCNECDFKTISLREMKTHKKTKHDPDDYEEESAFDKLFYNKTWKVRGFKDPISTLQIYKAKIQNTINHYLETKGAMKWYLGMQVKMYKPSINVEEAQEASPGFTSNPKITGGMWNFEYLYKESFDKIINDFTEFNANGSGWILDRVELISVNIARYQPIHLNYVEKQEQEDEDREAERMLSDNI